MSVAWPKLHALPLVGLRNLLLLLFILLPELIILSFDKKTNEMKMKIPCCFKFQIKSGNNLFFLSIIICLFKTMYSLLFFIKMYSLLYHKWIMLVFFF